MHTRAVLDGPINYTKIFQIIALENNQYDSELDNLSSGAGGVTYLKRRVLYGLIRVDRWIS
jgi:hypothetical protein